MPLRPFRTGLVLAVGILLGLAGSVAAQVGLRFVNPAGLYDATRYYSHLAIAPAGTTVYVAGQVGVDADRKPAGDKAAQIRRAVANLGTALAAAGAAPKDVVKITVYSVDHTDADLGPIGEATRGLFAGGPMPPSTLVPVPRLASSDLLFEIDAIAVLPGR